MAAEDHRVGFLVRLFDIIDVGPQAGFLHTGIAVLCRRIAEFVIDLVGHIAVGIDTLLQRTGNAVQRVLLFRQPGVGVVVTIQANADRQQHDKQQEAAGNVAGADGQLFILHSGCAFLNQRVTALALAVTANSRAATQAKATVRLEN